MKYKASVIIPVYHGEKTLRRCVESIALGQERNVQIILVEDRSGDRSWDICLELVDEFPCVIAIQNERNSGVSYTRNRGLERAEGEYILFVDSDDWVSGRYVSTLLHLAQKHPETLPICGQHFIDKVHADKRDYMWSNEPGKVNTVSADRFFELMDKFLLQQLWNKVFRRDIIRSAKISFDENQSMGEDFQFVLDYIEAAGIKECSVVNEPLYYYIRWNESSLMSNFGLVHNEQEYARVEQLCRLTGMADTQKKDAVIRQIKQNYVYHIARSKKLSRSDKREYIERLLGDGSAAQHLRRQQLLMKKEQFAQIIAAARQLPGKMRNVLHRLRIRGCIRRNRKALHCGDISILSQNCIGGVFYHDMGRAFLSPTVNLYIPEPDFIRFAQNPEYYLSVEPEVSWSENWPVGILGDVRIEFMHYDTCKEAKDSWLRRCKRVDLNKILVLATDRDGFDDSVYEQWKKIPYPKLLFTAHPQYCEDAVCYPEFATEGQVGDLIPERKMYRHGSLIKITERFL